MLLQAYLFPPGLGGIVSPKGLCFLLKCLCVLRTFLSKPAIDLTSDLQSGFAIHFQRELCLKICLLVGGGSGCSAHCMGTGVPDPQVQVVSMRVVGRQLSSKASRTPAPNKVWEVVHLKAPM